MPKSYKIFTGERGPWLPHPGLGSRWKVNALEVWRNRFFVIHHELGDKLEFCEALPDNDLHLTQTLCVFAKCTERFIKGLRLTEQLENCGCSQFALSVTLTYHKSLFLFIFNETIEDTMIFEQLIWGELWNICLGLWSHAFFLSLKQTYSFFARWWWFSSLLICILFMLWSFNIFDVTTIICEAYSVIYKASQWNLVQLGSRKPLNTLLCWFVRLGLTVSLQLYILIAN